jgi:hypothetical protein
MQCYSTTNYAAAYATATATATHTPTATKITTIEDNYAAA